MEKTRHLTVSLVLSIIIVVIGTSGYMIIEGWSLLDALYMTTITISTVGYSETHPVGQIGRMFTIFLVFFGVGLTLYVAAAVVQFMVEGRLRTILGRRKVDKQLQTIKNHYIICGYGRIGSVLCRKLKQSHIALVVVDKDPDLTTLLDEDGVLYVSAEATVEANLIRAGIQRAKGLIAVLATDTDNVFLTLTARQLCPDLFILARSGHQASKSKLTAAGANRVESPYDMGAVRMAQRIIRPTVTSFLDLAFTHKRKDILMEEIPVSPSSSLADVMLKDSGIRQRFNLIIIAIEKADGSMLFNPSFEAYLKGGDTVIAVGEEENLRGLQEILIPQ